MTLSILEDYWYLSVNSPKLTLSLTLVPNPNP